MISKAWISGLSLVALAGVLALAGCSNATLRNPLYSGSPQERSQVAGLVSGTLLGAGGGALVGAALIGAPGLGAGVGALIGAGAGWAVANASNKGMTNTEARLDKQQQELDQTRHELANTRHQLDEQYANETHHENGNGNASDYNQ